MLHLPICILSRIKLSLIVSQMVFFIVQSISFLIRMPTPRLGRVECKWELYPRPKQIFSTSWTTVLFFLELRRRSDMKIISSLLLITAINFL